jgi:hypothetical protein
MYDAIVFLYELQELFLYMVCSQAVVIPAKIFVEAIAKLLQAQEHNIIAFQ